MAQTVLPSQMFFFFFWLMLLLPLSHNGWFVTTCSAKKPPFDITTDTSSLIAFKNHLLTTSDVNNILRHNWTSADTSNTSTNNIPPVVVCHWIGVTCGIRHQRVVALDLADMGLEGTVPSHLGNLSFLVSLDLSNNKFHGQLPEEMARLRRLRYIKAGFNNLSGRIPSWLGFLTQLKHLNIQNNSFMGPIPASLSNCSKLQVLNASFNQLSGPIPQEMGNLRSLKDFQVVGNQLSGEIPHSIFNISSLEILSFAANGFSGSLPADVCTSSSKMWFLYLSWNELEGRIPSSLLLCSQLEVLALSYNNFYGPIPSALRNLTMLEEIYLGNNKLEGHILSELANLVHLKKLSLENAGLGGSIPSSIFKNLTSLEAISLKQNNLSGTIPNEIRNCTSIYMMLLGYNHLTGELPISIGGLPKLEYLSLGVNNIGGHVPDTLFNITSLRVLSLTVNQLKGDLPSTKGFGLPNLEQLHLGDNQFSGTIPEFICNSSGLTILNLNNNNFTGSPPHTLGNLRLLKWLTIGYNNLKVLNGETFYTSLNSCRYLRVFDMSFSQVNGPLPSSFGNLTSSLKLFGVRSCGIIGKIPQGIGNMSSLQSLILSSNQFIGSLPHTLQGLSNLEQFGAYDNNLSGLVMGNIFCRLPRLGQLLLQGNKFTGPLPYCLGNITTFIYIYLNDNELSSNIPASLWTLKDILELDLSSNSFTGHLLTDIGNLRAAIYINLTMNQLSGPLPTEIGSLQNLAQLYLGNNKFEGSIPESYGKLLSMEKLDLSNNNLSGEIPKSLELLSHLRMFNLSFNQLSGEVPSGGPFKNLTYLSFESNKALCGSPQFHVPQCQSDSFSKHLTKRQKNILFRYVLTGIILLSLVVLALLYVMLKCRNKHKVPLVKDVQPAVTHERISYHEILQATNSFDESNLLGKGSFGSVYKGAFRNGRTWAVKVFHLEVECAIRSFNTECNMLRNIRHRNLTKVISSCKNLDFMALVLEYMPNGSLDRWLYSHNYILDFKKRLDIMIDVASALDYLHHGYFVPVVHCDLKTSNVLLDEDMVAHVSDFGISEFLEEEGGIVQTNTLATFGYTAPEYGSEGLVSTSSDVYSFGIMLIEVFTRKRPTEEMFNEDLDLKLWVMQSLPDRVMEVIDENLVRQEDHHRSTIVQCASVILEVACNCTTKLAEERMNMKDVLASLKKTRLLFLANIT